MAEVFGPRRVFLAADPMLLIRRRAQQSGMGSPPGGVLSGLQIAGIATASLGLPVGGVLVDALGGGRCSS